MMLIRIAWLLVLGLPFGSGSLAQAPLTPVQTIELPEVPAGPYVDHMAIDLNGRRLFTTPQAQKAVAVLDLATGKVIATIRGLANPHAVHYREDRNRLFVTDGDDGSVKVFDATNYRAIKSIRLEVGADGIGYDSKTGFLYVANGGGDAGKAFSLISIVDTVREEKTGDIRVDAASLEAMVIDPSSDRLYANLPDANAIAVISLEKRRVTDTWPIKMSARNEAFALDPARHRLYVGCNAGDVRGSIVVVDTQTGKELQTLPVGSWVDSMFYDSARQRIYASSGVGEVFTFERRADGTYNALAPVDTAVMARTALYSAELDRLFVMVPHLGWTAAKVLVFRPQ
jgi:DNA-binding beta-propeller fold protein YncE